MSKTHISNDRPAFGYLTKKELAKCLRSTERSINNYVAKGVIPCVKLGTGRNCLVRFNWEQVCAALENQESYKSE